MSSDRLISRDEVLAGLPAKRASALLFTIESQTAHLAARSRLEFSLSSTTAYERNLAFLEAFALGSKLPLRPTIQHLERYAPQWTSLVPDNPQLRAALLQALAHKYHFSDRTTPNIRAALRLDEPAVQQAYHRLYHQPLETAFKTKLSISERLKWSATAIARQLESLPAFWMAFAITIALGLPQAFLALPIAVAELGAIATLGFLLMLGTINMLTMACMAEAIGRSGDFRYGNAFIKDLAANYLGKAGAFVFSFAVGIRVFLIALACYLGLSTTMASFTAIPATIWAVLLFLIGSYLLSRKSLNFTVSVMLLLAAFNIGLLLLLSLLACRHLQLDNLVYSNLSFLPGHSFNPQTLSKVFGVSLMLYFGHVYVGECAKLILPKDKSATSLIWGSVAGTAGLTLLYCLWVLAINGAIAPQILAAQSGTVLEPLAAQTGTMVKAIGAVLVTLLLGMAWLRSSGLLVNLVKEWLPDGIQPILMLPRQQGRLIWQPRDLSDRSFRIGLIYLGINSENLTKFRIELQLEGKIFQQEIEFAKHWNLEQLHNRFPELSRRNLSLNLKRHSANRDRVYLKISSSLILTYNGNFQKANTDKFFSRLNLPAKDLPQLTLTQKVKAIWQQNKPFFLTLSPLLLVFLLTEWLFFSGTQSFSSVLSFAGVLGNSLVGGIFPVLLLVSSRRKGELIPGVVFPILNRPLLLAGIYSFFLAILLIHGLFLWENLFARIGAMAIAILSIVTTLQMWRNGAFNLRTVLELQQDSRSPKPTLFKITAGGKPRQARVWLGYCQGEQHSQTASFEIPSPASLRYASFQLPNHQTEELRVWAHRYLSNGEFESLPAFLEVYQGNKLMQFDLKLFGGKVLLPQINERCCLKIRFSNEPFG